MIETEESTIPAPRRGWVPWGALAAVLLFVGIGAWWMLGSARLVSPGDENGSFGVSVPVQGAPVVYSFGGMLVCLEGVDSAVIDSVEPTSGDGLSVTDFAVRPMSAEGLGAKPRPLGFTDFGAERTVRGQCADEDYAELAVELSRPLDGTARAVGLTVHWSAGLLWGTLVVRGTFVLCDAPTTRGVPDCES